MRHIPTTHYLHNYAPTTSQPDIFGPDCGRLSRAAATLEAAAAAATSATVAAVAAKTPGASAIHAAPTPVIDLSREKSYIYSTGIAIYNIYIYSGVYTSEKMALPPSRRSGQITVDSIEAIVGEPIHRTDISCGPVLQIHENHVLSHFM